MVSFAIERASEAKGCERHQIDFDVDVVLGDAERFVDPFTREIFKERRIF